MEYFIEDLMMNGVTYIPPFSPRTLNSVEDTTDGDSSTMADSAVDVSNNVQEEDGVAIRA